MVTFTTLHYASLPQSAALYMTSEQREKETERQTDRKERDNFEPSGLQSQSSCHQQQLQP